jgi:hypothetical protein
MGAVVGSAQARALVGTAGPTSLEFTDAFAGTDGTPIVDMPVTTIRARLADREGGTRMEVRATFESREDMDRWVATGSDEGLQKALGQIDALLAGHR